MKKKVIVAVLAVICTILLIFAVIELTQVMRVNTGFYAVATTTPTPPVTVTPTAVADLGPLTETPLAVPEMYKTGVFAQTHNMMLPKGFSLSVFAAGMNGLRFFTFDSQQNMIVADLDAGKIFLLKDNDKDGVAEQKITIDQGLTVPSDADYYNGDLYVSQSTKVVAYRSLTSDGKYSKKETLIANLPAGGHLSRTFVLGPDGKIYLAIGSSCNICEEPDPHRAAINVYNLDGSGGEVFASGLRNTVGFQFHLNPQTGQNEIWGVDNGRDQIGDDIPPEEVNIIAKGKNYGWPYCYGKGIANPEFPQKSDYCKNQTEFPAFEMQAHSAPLDISFLPLNNSVYPAALKDSVFITFHGSWNRSIPTGYKLITINTADKSSKEKDFITGWVDSSGYVWGRPVGLGFDQRGNLYVSDDKAGAIYLVHYTP